LFYMIHLSMGDAFLEYAIYREYARLYDVIYHSYLEKTVPRVIDFVEHVFKAEAGREVRDVLDIACGTGGPTLELARRGYHVVGLDVSEEMIRIASRKAEEHGIGNVEFLVGDMRKLEFREEFDAVTCFFTSINYVVDDRDIMDVFNGVYRSLRPGGLFIFDTPNIIRAERWRRGDPIIWSVECGNTNILIVDVVSLNTVNQLINWRRILLVKEGDNIDIVFDHHRLRGYTVNELKLLARTTGFRKTIVYGDYIVGNKEPRDAHRIVFIAVK